MSTTSLKIDDAKRIAKRTGSEGVIVLVIPRFDDDLQVEGVSYGKDHARCQLMGILMDQIVDRLIKGEIHP